MYIDTRLKICFLVQAAAYFARSKLGGRRRGSAIAVDLEPLHHSGHVNINEPKVCKTTKGEEEKHIRTETFIRGR